MSQLKNKYNMLQLEKKSLNAMLVNLRNEHEQVLFNNIDKLF